jgi:uncharacterized membrane protein YfcA
VTIFTYIVLAFGALLGSTVSGVTGVGGGMVFLPFLVWAVGIKTAVPYLTVLLLVSNVSRAYFARQGIDWKVWRSFSLGAVPGAALGALFYTWLSPFWISKALGVYLIGYVLLSFSTLKWPRTVSLKAIAWAGFPAGVVSAVVGGSGPVVVPWLLQYGLIKEAFIGTEAVGAAIIHVAKLAVWGGAGLFGYRDLLLLIPLSFLMVAGSYLGTIILARTQVRAFRIILSVTLAAVGIRFLLY